ncbi:MAG: hypothetical protein AB9842_05570 [Bacteroidales bacterium]
MSKINFTFIRNKFFLAGVFTGIILSALAVLIIVSTYYPIPPKNKVSGTIVEQSYNPVVGEEGTVQASGTYCGSVYCDVAFENDPNNSLVRCHFDYTLSPGTIVVVLGINSGDFCQGGGCYLSVQPVIN